MCVLLVKKQCAVTLVDQVFQQTQNLDRRVENYGYHPLLRCRDRFSSAVIFLRQPFEKVTNKRKRRFFTQIQNHSLQKEREKNHFCIGFKYFLLLEGDEASYDNSVLVLRVH